MLDELEKAIQLELKKDQQPAQLYLFSEDERTQLRRDTAALEARLRPQGDRLIRWITASVGDSVRMIAIDEVLFFQAQDKYVRVVTADDEAIIRMSLKELLGGLDPDVFWQVHRGVLVRVQAIDRVRKDELGRHQLSVKGRNDVLPVSGAFQQRFRGM